MAEDLRPTATEQLDPAKIRELSSKWTLAGDAGLLKHLEASADRLMLRVSATNQQLNDAVWEAAQTTVRFDNAHNQFVALSAKQFFENRIYDEDIPRAPAASKPAQTKDIKTKSEREEETLASMREAVSLGCRLVGSHFKRIEIRPQDFDEDDDPTFKPEPIFEPLDPYLVRPLPFLIGSREFATSKSVGLVEQEQQRTSATVQQDDDLVIDVGTRVPKPPPLAQRPATEALAAPTEKAASDHSGLYAASSGSGDSGELFADERRGIAATNRQDVDSLFNEPIQSASHPPSRSIQDELAAKLGLPPNVISGERKPAAPVAKTVPSAAAPKPAAVESDADDDIFEAPPPLPQPNRSNANVPSRKADSLFETRTGGLFDSDEEDDLFAPPKLRAKGAVIASPPSNAVKSSTVDQKSLPPQVVAKVSAPSAVTGGIFDDVVDEPIDRSDIFAPVTSKAQPPAKSVQPSDTATKKTPVPSSTSNAASAFPKTTPKSLFDDDSEEDDIFSVAPRKSASPTVAKKDILEGSNKSSEKNLFPNDPSHANQKQPSAGTMQPSSQVNRSADAVVQQPSTVAKTDISNPLAVSRDEAENEVHKAVAVETNDRRASNTPLSTPLDVEKPLIPSLSDNSVLSDSKPSTKPVGGVAVFPNLPASSVRHEPAAVAAAAAVSKSPGKSAHEKSATPDLDEPPVLPSQRAAETPSPKSTRFALDDNSDDEDLFSPKGSINSTPSENARKILANVMVAGLKKNLAQATVPSSPHVSAPLTVDESQKSIDEQPPLLESLAKTRAKVPSSSRRPPSRRPFSPVKSSLFESDSDDGNEEKSNAAITQPATVASVVSPQAPTPSASISKQQPTSSSQAPQAQQGVKTSTVPAVSTKSPLFESDSDDGNEDKSKSAVTQPATVASVVSPQAPTPSACISKQQPTSSSEAPQAQQGVKTSTVPAVSMKSPLFESDSDDGNEDKSKSAVTQPATVASVPSPVIPSQAPTSASISKQQPTSSNKAPLAEQGVKASSVPAVTKKSPLFESGSDSGDDERTPPPATSKTVAANVAAQLSNDKLTQPTVPIQEVPPPTRVVEKQEKKLASEPTANAKVSAPSKAAAVLFESDDDEDIFAPVAAKSQPTAGAATKLPTKSATTVASSTSARLFADDDIDDIFAAKTSTVVKTPAEPTKVPAPAKTSAAANKTALFGDDSDSDLDIFK